ncbi:hypothetical protein [Pseudomonas helleri]|uniref:hypothetical protein n=1 Tax=Pseudomonas helleri TaxID=1608996 RepID=UPI00242A4005|nr:hypothetical protein [Pseudomonas helleri]
MYKIVSLNLRTESGDEYHYIFTDCVDANDVVFRVEQLLGEELGYVWSVEVRTSEEDSILVDAKITSAIHKRISELEDEIWSR